MKRRAWTVRYTRKKEMDEIRAYYRLMLDQPLTCGQVVDHALTLLADQIGTHGIENPAKREHE